MVTSRQVDTVRRQWIATGRCETMTTRILKTVVLIGAALLPPPVWTQEPAKNPLAGDPTAPARGKELFRRAGCVACHGDNARGAVGPDLTDDEWLRPPGDQMIFDTIKHGRSGTLMSPWSGDLSDEEIWSLVSFIDDEGAKRKASGQ